MELCLENNMNPRSQTNVQFFHKIFLGRQSTIIDDLLWWRGMWQRGSGRVRSSITMMIGGRSSFPWPEEAIQDGEQKGIVSPWKL